VGECQKGKTGEACSSKCYGLAHGNLLTTQDIRFKTKIVNNSVSFLVRCQPIAKIASGNKEVEAKSGIFFLTNEGILLLLKKFRKGGEYALLRKA
jgi:hypothetical protein